MQAAWPGLVSALALVLYAAVTFNAGRARARYRVKAPAVTGPPEFERALRVQQNTIEALVLFLPSLWLFVLFVSPLWGGIIGLVWIAGRALYAWSYLRDPETRGPGFLIGAVASVVLLIGALVGAIAAMRGACC
jgi:glutathione S-transferase